MRISIIGTHGIPAQYGGFETFAEHLAKACVESGLSTSVVNEKNHPARDFPGVEIKKSAYNKSEHPIKFYKDSLNLVKGSDIILVCGVGGSLFYNQIKKSGSKIITNVDGLEHKRRKYLFHQRAAVYILQSLAMKKSDCIVADSETIKKYWHFRYPKADNKIHAITYGADPCRPFDRSYLDGFKIKSNDYFLVIARLVPENNIHLIIKAFSHYLGEKKMVIVGNLDNNKYVEGLLKMAGKNIIFTDSIFDRNALDSLRQGCFIYIHGHSVGGTNPSLLEAMAAGCACICHENVFNREATANTQIYFNSSGDLAVLMNIMEQKRSNLPGIRIKSKLKAEEYTWENVCKSYINLFHEIAGK